MIPPKALVVVFTTLPSGRVTRVSTRSRSNCFHDITINGRPDDILEETETLHTSAELPSTTPDIDDHFLFIHLDHRNRTRVRRARYNFGQENTRGQLFDLNLRGLGKLLSKRLDEYGLTLVPLHQVRAIQTLPPN